MKRKYLSILCFSLVSLFLCVSSHARQVITESDRQWARQVLAQEQQLQNAFSENSVGVLYFNNEGQDASLNPLQKGLAVMLISDLSKIEGLQVLERVKLQALLDEMKLQISGLADPETVVKMGRLMQAKWVSGGDFQGERSNLTVKGKVLSVPDQKFSALEPVAGGLDKIFIIEKRLLEQILDQINIQLSSVQRQQLMAVPSIDYRAMWFFFLGIDASDNQQYEQAAQYYRQAISIDPSCSFAISALHELKALGLIRKKPSRRAFLRSIKESTSLADRLTPEYPVKRLRKPKDVPVKEEEEGVEQPPEDQPVGEQPPEEQVDEPVNPPDEQVEDSGPEDTTGGAENDTGNQQEYDNTVNPEDFLYPEPDSEPDSEPGSGGGSGYPYLPYVP